jgi:DNA-binding transcriptional regulator YhcF (GntR family)
MQDNLQSKNFQVNMDEFLPLRDVVFNTLRQAILTGELKPGERLMEIHLANRLGVSRTPIREAIRKLELEGLVLYVGGQAVAMTMGSRLDAETFDIHFEKADTDYPGAYALINRSFARHIREHHPEVKFLNREDDMGIEGLRKAKLSYHPHHMVEKCWAHRITEEFHDY